VPVPALRIKIADVEARSLMGHVGGARIGWGGIKQGAAADG
jgi:hypothetical protein